MPRIRLLLVLAVAAALSSPAPAGATVEGVVAPGFEVSYMVAPNPLPATNGLRLDAAGRLYIAQAFFNRISRIDPAAPDDVTRIASDTDAAQLQAPDDLAIGADGSLYATTVVGRNVTRIAPDGTRTVVASDISDGLTGPNGISFDRTGRLFATDLSFDPAHPAGGLWQIDPTGALPARPVVRGLPHPEGFAFGPDNIAYIPEFYAGRIDAVDVDARTVRTVAAGFGVLVALKIDPQGRIVVLETDTGTVWRVDRASGAREVVARGEPGLDNLAIAPDGTTYVSNFVRGGIRRVDEASGTLVPLGTEGSLSVPVSVNEAADGTLLVGDGTSVVAVDAEGSVRRVARFLLDGDGPTLQLATPGVIDHAGALYITDWLPLQDARVTRIDPVTGRHDAVARGFLYPWNIRRGPSGHLIVSDEGLGTIVDLDPATGAMLPLAAGLAAPAGLAYDAASGVAYASESGAGRVVAVGPGPLASRVVASGLDTPEGVAIAADGSLLVVEAGAGRLLRVDPSTGASSVVASGLPTRITGVTGLPFLNFSADVQVLRTGDVIVTGTEDASLLRLRPS